MIGALRQRGFWVAAHDWRGQGLSARSLPNRMLGHIDGASLFVADHAVLLDRLEREGAPKPWVGLGHSMGGCALLLCLAEGETRLTGAVITAPMLGLAGLGRHRGPLSGLIAVVGLLGGRGRALPIREALPSMAYFEGNALTHDRARYQRFVDLLAAHPDLALGRPTFGWLDFALRATALLAKPETARQIAMPVLMVNAGEDRVVDPAPVKQLAERLPQGRYLEVQGARHEILAETDAIAAPFWAGFDGFLDEIAPPPA
ncbi:MAG: pldB [Caulobacteraceae bacterium]|nr:pldB [Caulobacteraceae bacterium]